MSAPPPDLRELQQRFFQAVAAGAEPEERDEADPVLLGVVADRQPLAPAARIAIYAQMYWLRIVDVLHGDYPRVGAILGDARFHLLARAYLTRTPSRHPSLRHAGRGFAAFLAGRTGDEDPAFLADLARLEWCRVEVFDAPDATPLAIDDLRDVPASAWPALAFRLVPAVEILQAAWPVHQIWAAAEEPDAPRRWCAADTVLRVWREGFMVYQASMDAIEQRALATLRAGAPFAAICEAIEPLVPAGEAAGEAGSLLVRWVADGILERVL